MFPPMLLYVRIGSEARQGVGLWLPLFLVWLVLLPIVTLVLIVTAVADAALFLVGEPYHHYTELLVRGLGLLGATRGLVVSIHAQGNNVDVELV